MPGAGNGAKGERKRAAVAANAGERSPDGGRKAERSPAQETSTSWGAAQGKGCGPAGRSSRQTAGVRKRPRRNQRINRRVKGVRRSGSAAPRVRMRGRSSWPRFLFLSATSWANGDGDTDNAPHRTGRRRSRARPRFRITQRAGAYPCLRSPPGEQGSIPKQQTGSGMDPPVFWAGNTGKSQTTHSIIHPRARPGNPETRPFTPSRANRLPPSR